MGTAASRRGHCPTCARPYHLRTDGTIPAHATRTGRHGYCAGSRKPPTEDTVTTQPDRLHHLLDRARRGVILPAEGEALAGLVAELEATIEQADLDAEQQARHFHTICGERESYRQAWKQEQKHRATAEARVRELEAALLATADHRTRPTT